MLAEMSSHHFAEWMAYYQMEPFGAELLDLHLAKFEAMMASSQKDKKDPQQFRLWKKVVEVSGSFDPQRYFEDLKKAFKLKKD